MSKHKDAGPRFPASIRVKCTPLFKAALADVADSWTKRKGQEFDTSKLIRTLGERAIARERRLRAKRGRHGKAAA